MKPERYFIKHGEIYGVSHGDARTTYALKFTTWSDALTWLFTEEYDFRERELVSKTKAKQYGYKEDSMAKRKKDLYPCANEIDKYKRTWVDAEDKPDFIGSAPNYDKFKGWKPEEVLVWLNID